jgi:hypothetical protein
MATDTITCHLGTVISSVSTGTFQSWLASGLTITALIGGGFALVRFLIEYRKDAARRRYEIYDKLRERFDSPEFAKIFDALDRYAGTEGDDKIVAERALRTIDVTERSRLAAFIEHIALVAKSRILDYNLVQYQFGHYAQLCWESDPSWDALCEPSDNGAFNYRDNEPFWALFKAFAAKLKSSRPSVDALAI